ncbi:MAG: ABC transporter permease [Proteobacteria bacterium]|nr:ABC transporter permease [Pseudomonadota bacterium]
MRSFIDRDVVLGLSAWRVWSKWAWVDVKQRYRRSAIGPFWMTISLGVIIGGMGFVMGTLFRTELRVLMPYLCAGMILWTLLHSIVMDGCHVFAVNASVIKSINLPLSVYVYRMVLRNFIIFFHHILIMFVVMMVFSVPVNANTLLIFPALILYFINGVWISLLLGAMCARYRDIPQVMMNVLQFVFFVTPIFWMPQNLGGRDFIAHANIFFHFLDIARLPLLGQAPLALSWGICTLTTVGGLLLAMPAYGRFRRPLAGWL